MSALRCRDDPARDRGRKFRTRLRSAKGLVDLRAVQAERDLRYSTRDKNVAVWYLYQVPVHLFAFWVDAVRGTCSTGACCQVGCQLSWYQATVLLPPLTASTQNAGIAPRTSTRHLVPALRSRRGRLCLVNEIVVIAHGKFGRRLLVHDDRGIAMQLQRARRDHTRHRPLHRLRNRSRL